MYPTKWSKKLFIVIGVSQIFPHKIFKHIVSRKIFDTRNYLGLTRVMSVQLWYPSLNPNYHNHIHDNDIDFVPEACHQYFARVANILIWCISTSESRKMLKLLEEIQNNTESGARLNSTKTTSTPAGATLQHTMKIWFLSCSTK